MNGDAKQPEGSGNWQFKPGDADPQPAALAVAAPPASAAQQPVAPAPAAVPTPSQPAPVQQVVPEHPEVTWSAAEFIAHEKSPLWYVVLVLATLVLAVIVYLISRDKISTAVIVIVGIIFGVTAGRQPRPVQYLLDKRGITVNRAFRPYSEFKSFALVQEGPVNSIIFLPLKRFTLPLSLYVGTEDTDAVVGKLSDYLPLDQTHGHDAVDRFVQRIRF